MLGGQGCSNCEKEVSNPYTYTKLYVSNNVISIQVCIYIDTFHVRNIGEADMLCFGRLEVKIISVRLEGH